MVKKTNENEDTAAEASMAEAEEEVPDEVGINAEEEELGDGLSLCFVCFSLSYQGCRHRPAIWHGY